MDTTKLMNVEEAAGYVGLSTFTVRRLAKQGSIPAAKIGRAYRFKREDIDSYLRNQYKGGSNGADSTSQ
jgi:excisionase family DNA binding protein